MNKAIFTVPFLIFAVAAIAGEVVPALGTESRVGGVVLQGRGCLYVACGSNIGGKNQIKRLALGADGIPTSAEGVGEVDKAGLGGSSAAILGRWLFVVGGALGDKVVRFTVMDDGSLSGRAELPIARPEENALRSVGLVASGRHLVAIGGWQTRQVFTAKVGQDGSLEPWVKRRPLPAICFCQGRCFRIGRRIYVSGNQVFKGATDRVYSAEVDEEGLPTKWQRWAELPESTGKYDFREMPGGQRVFYRSEETGCMYVAPIVEDGEIGEWTKLGGRFPVLDYISVLAFPLNDKWILRYSNLSGDPRKFHPADLISLNCQ